MRTPDITKTRKPYGNTENCEFLGSTAPSDIFEVDPDRVRTMHAGVSVMFSDNVHNIGDTADEQLSNPKLVKSMDPIKLVVIDGALYPDQRQKMADSGDTSFHKNKNSKRCLILFTEDHRRLKAQLVAQPEILENLTTKDFGLSMTIRDKVNGGRSNCTLPSGGLVYYYEKCEGAVARFEK
ncbi:hypothetical protein BGZ83_005546 [Gryganskiella cystojenkinii]|nr:hypothetical protein BGZ83_005546 [Gryganskiella cystojenkinii]